MCGIYCEYCFKGNTNLFNIINGIKLVENRGYDSCGIFLKSQHDEKIIKKFNIDEFKENCVDDAFIGMGHTRWCTNGSPTLTNSHPHVCYRNKLTIVHNGCLENIKEISDYIGKNNIKCKSDTDTELIANFISHELYIKETNELLKILNNVKLDGMNTMLIWYENNLYIYKKINSLVFGIEDNKIKFSSERYGLNTSEVFYLNDGIYKITDDFINHPMRYCNIKAYNNIESIIDYSGKSYMEFEIYQQTSTNIKINQNIYDLFQSNNNFIIIGCGSSYNVSKFSEQYIRIHTNKKIFSFDACNFNKHDIPEMENVIVFVLSQSGETIDTYQAAQIIKKNIKYPIFCGITNSEHSLIYRYCDYNILMNIGRENAVASTKSFTAIMDIFMKLINKNPINIINWNKLENIVLKIISTINVQSVSNMFILGDHEYYPLALEGSLKLKEVSYINVQGYPISSLKHGPFALIDNETVIFLINPFGIENKKIISTYNEIKSRNGNVIILTNETNEFDNYTKILLKSETIEHYYKLLTIFFQLLSLRIGLLKNINIDKPRNLAKCVSVI